MQRKDQHQSSSEAQRKYIYIHDNMSSRTIKISGTPRLIGQIVSDYKLKKISDSHKKTAIREIENSALSQAFNSELHPRSSNMNTVFSLYSFAGGIGGAIFASTMRGLSNWYGANENEQIAQLTDEINKCTVFKLPISADLCLFGKSNKKQKEEAPLFCKEVRFKSISVPDLEKKRVLFFSHIEKDVMDKIERSEASPRMRKSG